MICFLDLEASSPEEDGFPIEIGWVDENGQPESYLIRPTETWLTQDGACPGWSADAERVHGITLATLIDEGVRYERVANRAALVLTARTVMACSDAPAFDGHWLAMLLEAAAIRREVHLVDVNHLYHLACRPLLDVLPLGDGPGRDRAEQRIRNVAKEIVNRAEEVEALRPRIQHRALPDAQSMWRTWWAIREAVSQRLAEEGCS